MLSSTGRPNSDSTAVPSVFMNQFKTKNLAQDAQNDPKAVETIQKFESIKIKDGKLILRSKTKE